MEADKQDDARRRGTTRHLRRRFAQAAILVYFLGFVSGAGGALRDADGPSADSEERSPPSPSLVGTWATEPPVALNASGAFLDVRATFDPAGGLRILSSMNGGDPEVCTGRFVTVETSDALHAVLVVTETDGRPNAGLCVSAAALRTDGSLDLEYSCRWIRLRKR